MDAEKLQIEAATRGKASSAIITFHLRISLKEAVMQAN